MREEEEEERFSEQLIYYTRPNTRSKPKNLLSKETNQTIIQLFIRCSNLQKYSIQYQTFIPNKLLQFLWIFIVCYLEGWW